MLIVGATQKSLITRHKRTRAYIEDDYDLLYGFLARFQDHFVTPNILTEVSNLLTQTEGPHRQQVMKTFSAFIRTVREEYVTSKAACRRKEFMRLGLADSTILDRAGTVSCVITDDLSLYLALGKAGQNVVNFNHVRSGAWRWE